jgi:hypothetical protein
VEKRGINKLASPRDSIYWQNEANRVEKIERGKLGINGKVFM